MTANAFSEDKERYLKTGMNYVVTKPIVRKDLLSVLLRAFGRFNNTPFLPVSLTNQHHPHLKNPELRVIA